MSSFHFKIWNDIRVNKWSKNVLNSTCTGCEWIDKQIVCVGQWISCRSPGELRVLVLALRAGIISVLIHGVSSLLYVLIVLLQCHAFEVMDAWKIEAFQSSGFWSVTVACSGQWSDWTTLFWELKIFAVSSTGNLREKCVSEDLTGYLTVYTHWELPFNCKQPPVQHWSFQKDSIDSRLEKS